MADLIFGHIRIHQDQVVRNARYVSGYNAIIKLILRIKWV